LTILFERGYLILAVNTPDTNYLACAKKLAQSIRAWHPEAKICLLTDKLVEEEVFDIIKLLPHGDQAINSTWKLSNDWQVYEATPFARTIKLEADMWVASPIEQWWELFKNRDLVISQGCRDFYDNTGKSRYYRKLFDNNNLPDVYNGITYWQASDTASEFFKLIKDMFEHWDNYKTLLKFPDELPTTDVVYAMAAVMVGIENATLPLGLGPTMVHMKKHMIPIQTEDWTSELVCEHIDGGVRINTVAQWGFVHYHIKDINNE
jgi:hypothetical protein